MQENNKWVLQISNLRRNYLAFFLVLIVVVTTGVMRKLGMVEKMQRSKKILEGSVIDNNNEAVRSAHQYSTDWNTTTSNTTNRTLDWWYNEMALKFCPNMRPKRSVSLFRRIFDLAREEINKKSNMLLSNNATCPFRFDTISRAFHAQSNWGRVTYAVNAQQENGDHILLYLTYLRIWKGGNNSIRKWFEGKNETFSQMPKKKFFVSDCLVTAIRDPISHFLSGYNEVEWRINLYPHDRENISQSWPFGRVEISNERFEQFLTDFLSCPLERKFPGILSKHPSTLQLQHVFSMSSILFGLSNRENLQLRYLPTLSNLTDRWGPFLAKSCPNGIFKSSINNRVPTNSHSSSQDNLKTYQNAKNVWMSGLHFSKALCAIHIIDYACWTDLPDGIPPMCLQLYQSYYQRGVFDDFI